MAWRAVQKRLSIAPALMVAAIMSIAAPAQAVTTTVSVTFNNGFIGEYSNGAQAPLHAVLFGTLNIRSVVISQTTDNGSFGGSQGNDYTVDLTVNYTNGTRATCSAAVNWLDKSSGNFVEGIGLTTASCSDGYTLSSGLSKTYLVRTAASSRVYQSSAVGVQATYSTGANTSRPVSGSADTRGALAALNAELGAVPPVITGPSGGAGATSSVVSVNENILTTQAVTTMTASKTVTWSLSGTDSSRLLIDPNTGVITFAASPDYEVPVDANTDNYYVVTVSAFDGTNTVTQTLTVIVLNVVEGGEPDLPPVITGPSGGPGALQSEISVNENQIGVTKMASNEAVTWSLGGADAALFQIAADGTITFRSPPDYEQPGDAAAIFNDYELIVYASDGVNTPLTAQSLTVHVLDLNDSGPAITGPSGQPGDPNTAIIVDEGTTTVFQMSAPGATSWAIVGGNDDGKFQILQDGTILFLVPPDYELPTDIGTNNTYVLTVMVTDGNNNISYQTVTVTVRNLDDTPPVITGPSGGAGAAASAITIFEGQTPVTTFTANEPATWSIVGGDDYLKFAIDPTTGALSFRTAPDYENPTDKGTNNVYVLVLRAVDARGNAAIQTVTVTVADIDDTPPVITGPSGGPGAAESALAMNEGLTPVHSFAANEKVSWSISGGDDKAGFSIDPATGALTFKAAPDFENPKDADGNNTYIVIIRATDEAGNYSEQRLTVTILNVDEIARKLSEIGGRLRTDLRTYAMRSLGDMLSFNEGMMQSADDDDGAGNCDANGKKAVSGGVHANETAQHASVNYTKQVTQCGRPYRVLVNGGMSVSGLNGDWNTRALGSLRLERRLGHGMTLGLGVLASTANDKLHSFADSHIKDTSFQVNVYGRARLSKTLRAGGFAGFGRAWYDFGLRDTDGFDMNGSMQGSRYAYGGMLSGDIYVEGMKLTTDAVLSHAVERLRNASLSARYLGESRSGIAFGVGTVDSTRLSVPVTGALALSGGTSDMGTKLLLSPGLLCEDVSVDTSSMSCGYQMGAKLNSRFSERSKGYLTYRFESVSGLKRNLIGLGLSWDVGATQMMQIGLDVDHGVAAMAADDNRAMISLRVAR